MQISQNFELFNEIKKLKVTKKYTDIIIYIVIYLVSNSKIEGTSCLRSHQRHLDE